MNIRETEKNAKKNNIFPFNIQTKDSIWFELNWKMPHKTTSKNKTKKK